MPLLIDPYEPDPTPAYEEPPMPMSMPASDQPPVNVVGEPPDDTPLEIDESGAADAPLSLDTEVGEHNAGDAPPADPLNPTICPVCGGSGGAVDSPGRSCPRCGGAGYVGPLALANASWLCESCGRGHLTDSRARPQECVHCKTPMVLLPELTAEERAAMNALPEDFIERICRGERPIAHRIFDSPPAPGQHPCQRCHAATDASRELCDYCEANAAYLPLPRGWHCPSCLSWRTCSPAPRKPPICEPCGVVMLPEEGSRFGDPAPTDLLERIRRDMISPRVEGVADKRRDGLPPGLTRELGRLVALTSQQSVALSQILQLAADAESSQTASLSVAVTTIRSIAAAARDGRGPAWTVADVTALVKACQGLLRFSEDIVAIPNTTLGKLHNQARAALLPFVPDSEPSADPRTHSTEG